MVFYYERSQLACPSSLPANVWSLQAIDALKKNGCPSSLYQGSFTSSGPPRTGLVKTLGMSRRGVRGSFVPPVRGANGSSSGSAVATAHTQGGTDNGYEESTRKW